jgi:hypothetical protein
LKNGLSTAGVMIAISPPLSPPLLAPESFDVEDDESSPPQPATTKAATSARASTSRMALSCNI